MDYRPDPFILVLFGFIFLLDVASIYVFAEALSQTSGNVSPFEVLHLAMSCFAILSMIVFVIYYVCTHHRERPVQIPYICAFGSIFLSNLVIAISVSVRAGSHLCDEFSSLSPSNNCVWGGISIIFPWVTTVFSAGGLIVTIAESHLRPIEVLTKRSREAVEHERRNWLIGCYAENLKALKGNTRHTVFESAGTSVAFNPYTDKSMIASPDPGPDNYQVVLSTNSAVGMSNPGITADTSPASSEEVVEYSQESVEPVVGSHHEASATSSFPSQTGSPTDSRIIGGSAELGVVDHLDADTDLEDTYPVRRRRQMRPRRLLSGAVRPAKVFVIKFKEPITVPVRDESPVDTSNLPSELESVS